MAISTYKTYLMHSETASGTYTKLVDIKEFPDLGQAPDTIDVTTLSDGQHMYINDIVDTGSLEFTANYTKEDYETVKAVCGKTHYFAIFFGDQTSGADGAFYFTGEAACWVNGGSVGDAVEMGISIAPSTEISNTKPEA